jgi:hypothetical protein
VFKFSINFHLFYNVSEDSLAPFCFPFGYLFSKFPGSVVFNVFNFLHIPFLPIVTGTPAWPQNIPIRFLGMFFSESVCIKVAPRAFPFIPWFSKV